MKRQTTDASILAARTRKRRQAERDRWARESMARQARLSGDEAVALYRLEKARRAERPDPGIAAAIALYQRVEAERERAGRGGRPRTKPVTRRRLREGTE